MKLKKKKLNKDRSGFKHRCALSPRTLRLFFGTHGFFFKNCCRVELIYLVMLRKILKRHKHYVKDRGSYHKRIWFWLRKNYIISRKSKNARMGKGKGKFLRYAIRVPTNYVILEFYGWSHYYLRSIKYKFTKKTFLHLGVYTQELGREKAAVYNTQYARQFIKKYTL